MEINAQDVIDRLTSRIGKLEGELAVAQAQIEMLQAYHPDAGQSSSENHAPRQPLEGEVV